MELFPRLTPFFMALHNLSARPLRTLLTILGIAMGVAVVLAVNMTNQGTLESLQSMFDRAIGKAELLVVPPRGDDAFDEALLARIQRTEGVQVAAPTAWVSTYLAEESPGTEARWAAGGVQLGKLYEIRGIDPALDPAIRVYTISSGRMFSGSRYETVIPESLAEEKKLSIGDDFSIATSYGVENLEIVGLLAGEGAAAINNGDIAFVALEVLQEIYQTGDQVSEIAVRAAPELSGDLHSLEALKILLEERLAGEARSIYPSARSDLVPRMLDSYQTGLTFFSIIALFVGTFLIYNTFSMTVAERAREIGMLRAIGVSRGQIFGQVFVEAAVLALVGSVCGLGAGIGLARGLMLVLGGFMSVENSILSASQESLLISIWVGIFVTFVAAFIPALQATRISPLEALSIRSRLASRVRSVVWVSGVMLMFIGWAMVEKLAWREEVVVAATIAGIVLLLLGSVLALPLIIGILERISRAPAYLFFRNEGALGSTNVRRSVMRTTLTVACMMIAQVMIIGINSISFIFKQDISDWVNSALGGDLYIVSVDPMSETFANQLKLVPGVESVSPMRYLHVRISPSALASEEEQDEKLLFTAIEPVLFRRIGDMVFASGQGDRAANWAMLSQGNALFVSTVVADEYHLQQGDEIRLITRRGEYPFKVAAVVTDFTGQGYVITGTYSDLRRWFSESGVDRFIITVSDGYNPDHVSQAIEDRFGKIENIDIQTTDTLRSSVLSMLDQVFLLFDVLSMIGVVIGAVGVTNTLSMNVMERTREVGGLRSLGMTRLQIMRMILSESLVMGLMGCLYGLPFGYFLSKEFVNAVVSLTGYEVSYQFLPRPYWISLVIAVVVTQFAALAPARRAASFNIINAIKNE